MLNENDMCHCVTLNKLWGVPPSTEQDHAQMTLRSECRR